MAKILNHIQYTGSAQHAVGNGSINGAHVLRPAYLPDPALVEAVNLSIYLERPLLIRGEPGCGKTRLARAVADELDLPYEAWYVKSTSHARDGLYTYDAIGRLHDAHLASTGRIDVAKAARVENPANYMRWGQLGRAFQNEQRTVLLIDEIDKADIDFPNDLLQALDEQRFLIEETGDEIHAQQPPIVFITSNDEKELPDAFLRRCLFHYMTFPHFDRLVEIVEAHFPTASSVVIEAAVQRFTQLREQMTVAKGNAGKKVSTSELIDWFRVLNDYPDDDILKQLQGTLPYGSVLLKSWEDHVRFLSRGDMPKA